MSGSEEIVAGLALTLVSNEYAFDDYDVAFNELGVRRVCVSHAIRIGETFNVYFGKSGKLGVVWRGSLESSLRQCDLPKYVKEAGNL